MRCVAAGAASLHRQRALLSGTRHRSSSAAVAHVRTALIEAGVALSDNPYERARHGRGESFHAPQPPALVAFPNTSNEVRTIVRACVTHRVPLVPFGAGTSLEGHVGAVQPESLSVDMSRLQEISQLPQQPSHEDEDNNEEQPPDALVVVQAGVTREQLSQALRATGYQFTVDPGAATATIGGMVACNAAGTTTVRYGALRDNLLGVECILADDDATLVRTGCRTRKNSAGYDLTSLFCGSEGTLGVVTQATLRVWPVPAHVGAGRVSFGSVADAARAVAHLSCLGVDLVRCELLDTASVAAFNAYNPPSPQGVASTTDHREELALLPTLFLELQAASESILAEQIQIVAQVLQDEAVETQWAFGADERQALWKARHSLYYAAIASRPEATGAMVTDACVPLSHLPALLEATAADVRAEGIVGPCFGHAGDGSFHCILPVSDNDPPAYWERVHRVNANLLRRTLAVGGTCTGEHGVGAGKIPYLEEQYGPGAVHAMKLIKQSLDPYGLMNPGKVVDMS